MYAHRNQKRVNGESYFVHPYNVFLSYQRFVGIEEDTFDVDYVLLEKIGIPFFGVCEACLLHDVLEDTDFTMRDIEDIYEELKLKEHFINYIKQPLNKVTHDENDTYEEYINKCLSDSVSAMVKMLDLQNNLQIITLDEFNEENYQRALKNYRVDLI